MVKFLTFFSKFFVFNLLILSLLFCSDEEDPFHVNVRFISPIQGADWQQGNTYQVKADISASQSVGQVVYYLKNPSGNQVLTSRFTIKVNQQAFMLEEYLRFQLSEPLSQSELLLELQIYNANLSAYRTATRRIFTSPTAEAPIYQFAFLEDNGKLAIWQASLNEGFEEKTTINGRYQKAVFANQGDWLAVWTKEPQDLSFLAFSEENPRWTLQERQAAINRQNIKDVQATTSGLYVLQENGTLYHLNANGTNRGSWGSDSAEVNAFKATDETLYLHWKSGSMAWFEKIDLASRSSVYVIAYATPHALDWLAVEEGGFLFINRQNPPELLYLDSRRGDVYTRKESLPAFSKLKNLYNGQYLLNNNSSQFVLTAESSTYRWDEITHQNKLLAAHPAGRKWYWVQNGQILLATPPNNKEFTKIKAFPNQIVDFFVVK